ncbi:hypothetical protein ARMGADRAFT_1039460 [Armillaria gallica]|uniref:Uncharacterized protein n=1 Tax=Armillaria gallica TaxID=47427 RepID=A0A2H3CDZ1_ARMGA|nr:hypothetical protein ARMGADRAFT_1039460 [Armillaria gallica]
MDRMLGWSDVDPFSMEDATDIRWTKDYISHKPAMTHAAAMDFTFRVPSSWLAKSDHASHTFTPMKPAEKRKGRASKIFDVKQNEVDKHTCGHSDVMVPVGCKWVNNSCTYDAVISILYNFWSTTFAENTSWNKSGITLGEHYIESILKSSCSEDI